MGRTAVVRTGSCGLDAIFGRKRRSANADWLCLGNGREQWAGCGAVLRLRNRPAVSTTSWTVYQQKRVGRGCAAGADLGSGGAPLGTGFVASAGCVVT